MPKLIECPRCKEKFDPKDAEILKCPTCEEEVCTAHCVAGKHVACFQCEASAQNE